MLFVLYDTFIKGHDSEQVHTHEESATLIPHQVLASVSNGIMREIYVWSPDTDVLFLLLDLVSCGHIASPTRLKLITRKGRKKRETDVVECIQAIEY